MKVFFEKTIVPSVNNEVIAWHIQHGWVWNVRQHDGAAIGVFFATLLCGDGVILHFSPMPGIRIAPAVTLAAFRKGIRIAAPLGVVFATIPEDNSKLIRCAKRLGFVETSAGFVREGQGKIALLKYLPNKNAIL